MSGQQHIRRARTGPYQNTLPALDRFTHLLTETAMASASTKVATMKSILAPSMTLKGHGDFIGSISYFPDGQRMISGSDDKTTRQWDLKEGKEVEEGWDVCSSTQSSSPGEHPILAS
ncbi:hypothetical protein BDR05DRAFT_1001005 [Suillus weaverae]|nr:hypothetical protein BDR05DRAFT_1001005 [Suillus weaverae]